VDQSTQSNPSSPLLKTTAIVGVTFTACAADTSARTPETSLVIFRHDLD
jgi:hypothetical protein